MTEAKKPKVKAKVKDVPEAIRPQNDSVGETLRVARMAKNMSIEDVSAIIHIRGVQLKAIEENNLEGLPGMTYAVGFVRSYANFLGLNGVEIVHKFKAEHGNAPDPAKLAFPEPIPESRIPNPMMIGVGSFLAVLLLVVWSVYSNMHGSSKTVEQIPAAPDVATTAGISTETMPFQPEASLGTGALPPVTAAIPEPRPADKLAAPTLIQPPAEVPKADKIVEIPAATEGSSPAVQETSEKKLVAAPAEGEQKPDGERIDIKRGKGRILLQANQASWIQVMGPDEKVIYRKVLRPGEQYYVPDQPGLSLVTANAGGLDISVDGQPVPALGEPGEILRGIALDPAALKRRRPKPQD